MNSKVIKRVLALLLSILLIAQMIPTNIVMANNQSSGQFADIEKYSTEIKQLVDLEVIEGYPDNTFRPYNNITRAQGVAMIIREMNLDISKRPNPHYKDIQTGYRFYNEIAAAVDEGIIDGFTDGTFGPEEKMTRSQMAKILVNAYHLKLQDSKINRFSDVPTDHWAHDYIKILASNGITLGYDDGTFKPENSLTRLHFSLFWPAT